MEQVRQESWAGLEPAELRRFRKELGLTQGALADQLGVTPITIHRWETGQSRPHRIARERLREIRERHVDGPAVRSSSAGATEAPPPFDFAGSPEAASAVAEALRLTYGHQFNPVFASETSQIDPLPHQRIAVYEHMLKQDPLRFLLADDAGAGKTIMTGLTVREMLSRHRIRRVLIVPPAGLVGNWERELRTLFRLRFRIVAGSGKQGDNPFQGPGSEYVIVSLDTLRGKQIFGRLCDAETVPYDLVVFDEAHKLTASKQNDWERKTLRYELAEALAGCAEPGNRFRGLGWSARHLLLLTATPHMGKDSPYYFLWRLLVPEALGTEEAFRRLPAEVRFRHFIRRTKEEMVGLDGKPLFPQRKCFTFSYDLSPGPAGEQALYDHTTAYLRDTYGRALTNKPAMQLALSVFQRRLASSTWALLRSFERRLEKLGQIVVALESGKMSGTDLQRQQGRFQDEFSKDFFDEHSADDDAGEGGIGEEHEQYEDAVLGALVSVAIDELKHEIGTLSDLSAQARQLYESGREAKFEKLREVLGDRRFAGEKCLIFTEHRDTADYLLRRLEALGFSGQVGQIHGGLDWKEREEQVAAFRDPDGTRYLVATDAAGEGINLQFCRLMLNYDIPWNPARLEQRMGRIHRYGQKHDVQIINFVAGGTYEGRVLQVLLQKLESIRQELRSDKVFDVIGRLFENVSLRQHMLEMQGGGTDQQAIDRISSALATEHVSGIAERERQIYGEGGDVTKRLGSLRAEVDRERYLQLLPAYVRRLVEKGAALFGIEIRGNLDGVFSLAAKRPRALDWLFPSLAAYPADLRERLSVRRSQGGTACIWLRPGEPVFDALQGQILKAFGSDALRGCILIDPRAESPRLFHLAEVTLEEVAEEPRADGASGGSPNLERRILERRLVGLCQKDDGTLSECDIEHLLLLHSRNRIPPGSVPLAGQALGMRAKAALFAEQEVLGCLIKERQEATQAELPSRQRQLELDFALRGAEIARRRNEIFRQRSRNEEEHEEIKRQQRELGIERDKAMKSLERSSKQGLSGSVRFLWHGLAVPPSGHEDVEAYDQSVETKAVQIAVDWELARNATVTDVSKPDLARSAGLPNWPGFDLLACRSGEETRCIEVKGRAGRGAIQMEANEWKQAVNLKDRYWLYAVLDCATTTPRLLRVQNPFMKLLARQQESSSFAISSAQLLAVADDGR